MTTTTTPQTALLTFGGITIPAGCRRIFITAKLESSNGDPRIQPTGFPDVGPVLYPDPAGKDGNGLICIIESEASMANRLEEVCLADKHTGTLRAELQGLPYIKLTADGTPTGQFITASTIDGHRFASEYIMLAQVPSDGANDSTVSDAAQAALPANTKAEKMKTAAGKPMEFVEVIRNYMGMTIPDKCPAANVPRIFQFAAEHDPLALIHGFQISIKKKLTFVGLRSPRALTASILGLRCDRIVVPGVRIDPIGTGDAKQAIFQKTRITAKEIEAKFSIDIGLLQSLRLSEDATQQQTRFHLLLKIALCKVSWFLKELSTGMRLRTECDLRLAKIEPEQGKDTPAGFNVFSQWDRTDAAESVFDFAAVLADAGSLNCAEALVPASIQSPYVLKHVAKKAEEKSTDPDSPSDAPEQDADDNSSSD